MTAVDAKAPPPSAFCGLMREVSSVWVIAAIPMLLGALVSLGNWATLIASWRHKRGVSFVPLIGAALLAAGMPLHRPTRPCAPLALVLDFGTLIFLIALPTLVRELGTKPQAPSDTCSTKPRQSDVDLREKKPK